MAKRTNSDPARDEDSIEPGQDRVFATGTKYEGRSVPPQGWGLETTPGLGTGQVDFVQTAGGVLLPRFFTMHLTPPGPAKQKIRVMYDVRADGIVANAVWSRGLDAFQSLDTLRRIASVEVWNRVAVHDMGLRLAMKQLAANKDGVEVLMRSRHLSKEAAEGLLAAFESEQGVWPTFQPGSAPPAPVDSPQWSSALEGWRDQITSGSLFSTVAGIPMRPGVRRNRITDEHLASVAAVYRAAQQAGEPPTMAVATQFQTSHSTATRWVGLARSTGLLGPTRKGRAGEVKPAEADPPAQGS